MKARSRLDKKMTAAVAKVHISFIHMLNGKKLYNFRIYKPEEQLSDVFLCVFALKSLLEGSGEFTWLSLSLF